MTFYTSFQHKSRITVLVCHLRNRLPVGGGCVCFAVVFFLFFGFFPSTKTMRQLFSGMAEWIFMKLLPNNRGGKCSLKRRAAAWRKSCRRLANVDDLRHLRYDSFAITRGRHVIYADSCRITRGRYTAVVLYNNERANWCNLVCTMQSC